MVYMNGGAVAAQRQRIYLAGSCLMPHKFTPFGKRQQMNSEMRNCHSRQLVIYILLIRNLFFLRCCCAFQSKFLIFYNNVTLFFSVFFLFQPHTHTY